MLWALEGREVPEEPDVEVFHPEAVEANLPVAKLSVEGQSPFNTASEVVANLVIVTPSIAW